MQSYAQSQRELYRRCKWKKGFEGSQLGYHRVQGVLSH